jgi:hypothetical protein
MAKITRIGYGQVEPNHLSAQRTGQIYAQLPAVDSIDKLENGQFVKYDYTSGKVNFDGEGEYMLVLNEVKLYDERETYKDFVMKKENYVGGVMVPRVFKTNVGDIYTTNCINPASEVAEGSSLVVGDKGILEVTDNTENAEMIWKVVKVYTMADGQAAVKLQRIK